jgi:hypothetical protein
MFDRRRRRTLRAAHDAIADLGCPRVGIHFGPVKLRENTPADFCAPCTEVDGLATSLTAASWGSPAVAGAAERERARVAGDAMPPGSESRRHGHYCLAGIETPVVSSGRGGVSPLRRRRRRQGIASCDGDAWRPVRGFATACRAGRVRRLRTPA